MITSELTFDQDLQIHLGSCLVSGVCWSFVGELECVVGAYLTSDCVEEAACLEIRRMSLHDCLDTRVLGRHKWSLVALQWLVRTDVMA